MALVIPAGVPAAIADKMRTELHATLQDAEVRKTLMSMAVIIETSSAEAVQQRIEADLKCWRALAIKAKIQPE